MNADIPAVLTVECLVLTTIIEVEGLLNLGIHPKGENQKQKD